MEPHAQPGAPRRGRGRLPSGDDLRRLRARGTRVLVLAALTGVLVGLAVAAFEAVAGEVLLHRTLALPVGLQVVAPAVGLVLAWVVLRSLGRGTTPATSDDVLVAYHRDGGTMALDQVPGKMLGATATLGAGGAMGFEGPSIYLGAAIGSLVRRWFPRSFSAEDQRTLLVAGAAAGVAAIFQAPATGAVFALEVPYREDSAAAAAVPAVMAAAASYLTFTVFFGRERPLPLGGPTPPLDLRSLGGALVMGILAGFGARLFAGVLRRAKTALLGVPAWARLAGTGAGLALVGGVTWAVYDGPLSLGPGFGAIDWTEGLRRPLGLVVLLLVVRAVATTLTLAGGGVGGLFIPLLVKGWLLGTAVEVVVGGDTMLFPVIGAAAFLGAGFRTPIAAVVFVAEATGRPGFVVPALVATAVAQFVMGDVSVSAYQLTRRVDLVTRRDRRPVVDACTAPPPDLAPDAPEVPATATVGDARRALAASGAPYVVVRDGTTVVGVVTPGTVLALEPPPE
ncbi:MAG: chloride channel protein [Actinomycetota bacterium]